MPVYIHKQGSAFMAVLFFSRNLVTDICNAVARWVAVCGLVTVFWMVGAGFPVAAQSAVAQTAPQQSALEKLVIVTANGEKIFQVEVMRTMDERARGLMFRRYLPQDRGMLFDFAVEAQVAMLHPAEVAHGALCRIIEFQLGAELCVRGGSQCRKVGVSRPSSGATGRTRQVLCFHIRTLVEYDQWHPKEQPSPVPPARSAWDSFIFHARQTPTQRPLTNVP